ncbi:MAG: TetR/AcrR family transcriptional regulator [Firmicutes bacterium]|nr:TetR/AcrR family transcriptional regulator [Bacillota bacterium]
MKEKKDNRSVKRTKAALKNCAIALLKEKPLHQISVREITEMADLNRGTFYLHYKDVYELIEEIESDFITEFSNITSRDIPSSIEDSPYPLLLDLFTFIDNNQDFCSLLLDNIRSGRFSDRIKNVIEDKLLSRLDYITENTPKEELDIYYAYALSGCVGIVEHWLTQKPRPEPQQIATVTEHVLRNGLFGIIENK